MTKELHARTAKAVAELQKRALPASVDVIQTVAPGFGSGSIRGTLRYMRAMKGATVLYFAGPPLYVRGCLHIFSLRTSASGVQLSYAFAVQTAAPQEGFGSDVRLWRNGAEALRLAEKEWPQMLRTRTGKYHLGFCLWQPGEIAARVAVGAAWLKADYKTISAAERAPAAELLHDAVSGYAWNPVAVSEYGTTFAPSPWAHYCSVCGGGIGRGTCRSQGRCQCCQAIYADAKITPTEAPLPPVLWEGCPIKFKIPPMRALRMHYREWVDSGDTEMVQEPQHLRMSRCITLARGGDIECS
jgi:hypothetical protein